MRYWLFKSEPKDYSIYDLQNEPEQTTQWHGIRNYQARNLLRDHIQLGDSVLFYHSSCKPTAVMGIAKIASETYTDPTQFDTTSQYFDAKSTISKPRWLCIDITLQEVFSKQVELSVIKKAPALANMTLLNQGRLSIQPVTLPEFETIKKIAADK